MFQISAITLISLIICLSHCIVWADISDSESPAALLFVHKSTKAPHIVEGMPFVIDYRIINKGEASASEIKLLDKYPIQSFQIDGINHEGGTINIDIDDLAPDESYSFNVTLTPKVKGIVDFNRYLARIQYNPFTEADEAEGADPDYRRGTSSSLGRLKVLTKAEYIKLTSYYVKEWAVFVLGFVLAIYVPYSNLVEDKVGSASSSRSGASSPKKH